jgi:hypothetical protein
MLSARHGSAPIAARTTEVSTCAGLACYIANSYTACARLGYYSSEERHTVALRTHNDIVTCASNVNQYLCSSVVCSSSRTSVLRSSSLLL